MYLIIDAYNPPNGDDGELEIRQTGQYIGVYVGGAESLAVAREGMARLCPKDDTRDRAGKGACVWKTNSPQFNIGDSIKWNDPRVKALDTYELQRIFGRTS